MKLIKVAGSCLNQTPRDWNGNFNNIKDAINEAKANQVSVICLPEMSICGYGLEDDYFCLNVCQRSLEMLAKIIPLTEDIIVNVGLPILFNNSLYNAVATISNGILHGFVCKQHLANDGIFYESRWFKPWPKGVVQTISFGKEVYNIGDIHFNIGGIKYGYEICEDSWTANRPGTVLAAKGVDVILNPSASNFSFGKFKTRQRLVVDASRAFNATYIYTNLVGNESGRVIYDGGTMIASGGKMIAIGSRFTYKNHLITSAIVDIDTTRTFQSRTASYTPDVKNYNEGCVNVKFKYPIILNNQIQATNLLQESWENSINVKHEECTRAIGLGLMDYMRKSHTNGFVISLSGGADSAMVSYLCAAGIKLGCSELGAIEFGKKYCPNVIQYNGNESIEWYIKNLITTAYQATAQSGHITKEAASVLASQLGIPHFEFDVEPLMIEYKKLGEIIQGKPLTFKDNDLTLQNLQARVRAPGIWMVANMQGKLLLTTSNRSEAAVGYCTLDGDTAGGLAPIAGISKEYIREYLKWAEKFGTEDKKIEMLPCLKLVNNQQPTAELRPADCNQTDEKDLMPYWLLDKIERLVIVNRYTPVEIYLTLKDTSEILNNQLIGYITKFFKLFSMNQWKRERYAISFHMDDYNLDPKTWCRAPILSGGYVEELQELQTYITK